MSTPDPSRRTARVLVAALVATLAGTGLPATATTGPPDIAPHDTAGADVAIVPAVVRAPDGRAELDVVLGTGAPADVIVTPRLAAPAVADDGTVTAGDGSVAGAVGPASRLAPGERLRVVATDLTGPVLVVAEVRPADQAPGDAPVSAATALVLPGDVGAPPTVALTSVGDETRAVVSSPAPLLVTVAVAGRQRTTFPERLVLPDRPVELAVAPARWPLPTEVVVTDEDGRTVRASTGTAPLALVAGALVLLAAVVLVAVRRRVRRG